jgi:hypothetical protein
MREGYGLPPEEVRAKIWDKAYYSRFKCVGTTRKRMEKLKDLIWNDYDNFWFYVMRKPEDIQQIILGELMHRGIYKPKR